MNPEFYDKPQEGKENMENAKIQSPKTELLLSSYEGISIRTFLYTLTKKSNICQSPDDRPSEIQFMEGEAIVLYGMLRRDGFFDDILDEPGCTICATEKFEKDLMESMQRQLDVIRMVREYFTTPENINKYSICAIHRPFNPKNCIPNIVHGWPRENGPSRWPELNGPCRWPELNGPCRWPELNGPSRWPELNGASSWPEMNGASRWPQVRSNDTPNYLNVFPPSNFAQASNLNTSDYFANQSPAEYETPLIPSYFAGQTLSKLFPHVFKDPACQQQYPSSYIYIPKDSYPREIPNDSYSSGSNNKSFVTSCPIVRGQNFFGNHSNRAINGLQNVIPSNNIQNNGDNNLYNMGSRGDDNILYHRGSETNKINNFFNQGVVLSPRMNPARQQLINNAISNFTADMQDDIQRGNRVGRKIVGKRY